MRWRMRIEARSRTQEISCEGLLSCEVMQRGHMHNAAPVCGQTVRHCRPQAGLWGRGILFVCVCLETCLHITKKTLTTSRSCMTKLTTVPLCTRNRVKSKNRTAGCGKHRDNSTSTTKVSPQAPGSRSCAPFSIHA